MSSSREMVLFCRTSKLSAVRRENSAQTRSQTVPCSGSRNKIFAQVGTLDLVSQKEPLHPALNAPVAMLAFNHKQGTYGVAADAGPEDSTTPEGPTDVADPTPAWLRSEVNNFEK